MTVLVDYGIGNLRSLERAFGRAGVPVLRSGHVADVQAASRLVLPGVGAFGACADALAATGLGDVVRERVDGGVPLLGVCVGMQLLFEGSDEGAEQAGLGLLPGRVVRFRADLPDPAGGQLKVPHMGWNALRPRRSHPTVDGLGDAPHVYFVHSYLAAPDDPAIVVADADYGGPVPAVVARGHVVGVQFHPEKSGPVGLALLRGWADAPPNGEQAEAFTGAVPSVLA